MTATSNIQPITDGWTTTRHPAPLDADDVIAEATRYGTPSPTIDGAIAWAVTPRATAASTFSGTDAEASLHTDSQYAANPESAFVLHCVRPAGCGGGNSFLLHATTVIDALTDTARWATEILTTVPVPFAAPAVFAEHGINHGLVLGPNGTIRWRHDTVQAGIAQAGAPRHVRAAVDVLADLLDRLPRTWLRLEAGQSLVVDNTRMLHGRTAFTDPTRMLWRVRVHTP